MKRIYVITGIICYFTVLAIVSSAYSRPVDMSIKPVLIITYRVFQLHTECRFTVTSAYRSEEHNKAVGGAPKSYHMQGLALDIVPLKSCSKSLRELAEIATLYFNGVIVYKTHLHIDLGDRMYHQLGVK